MKRTPVFIPFPLPFPVLPVRPLVPLTTAPAFVDGPVLLSPAVTLNVEAIGERYELGEAIGGR
jgi:hypothetical protein